MDRNEFGQRYSPYDRAESGFHQNSATFQRSHEFRFNRIGRQNTPHKHRNYRQFDERLDSRNRPWMGNRRNMRNVPTFGEQNFENHYSNAERTFDSRGNEILPGQLNLPDNNPSLTLVEPVNPITSKADFLIKSVFSQKGVRSKLIFLETDGCNPLHTLQCTVDYYKVRMEVDTNENNEYVLKIGDEELARGAFINKQSAKKALGEEALKILKKDCFFITKKQVYEDVKISQQDSKGTTSQTNLTGSKAHQMMLKMGWSGKGLGVNEQGSLQTVAESLEQNVSKCGLGSKEGPPIFTRINNILEEFAKSPKIAVLRFEPDFSLEERAHIHKMAQKINLKSKSEGKGEDRRLTITKKLNRYELVHNLLIGGSENAMYELEIPVNFQNLWHCNNL